MSVGPGAASPTQRGPPCPLLKLSYPDRVHVLQVEYIRRPVGGRGRVVQPLARAMIFSTSGCGVKKPGGDDPSGTADIAFRSGPRGTSVVGTGGVRLVDEPSPAEALRAEPPRRGRDGGSAIRGTSGCAERFPSRSVRLNVDRICDLVPTPGCADALEKPPAPAGGKQEIPGVGWTVMPVAARVSRCLWKTLLTDGCGDGGRVPGPGESAAPVPPLGRPNGPPSPDRSCV